MPVELLDKPKITKRDLKKITLASGGHDDRSNGLCAMEAAAWLAGEKHTDHPVCVCPVLAQFFRSWNDGLPNNADRDRLLKPFLPRLLNTADPAKVLPRGWLVLDWSIRTSTPTWLRLAKLDKEADALEALSPITDFATLNAAEVPLSEANRANAAAWAAARAAANAAARAAAWAAANAAAWAAAWDAANAAARAAARAAANAAARAAAWAAANAAARAAAWDAANAAARAAAWDAAALKPTTEKLQASAVDLVERMLAV